VNLLLWLDRAVAAMCSHINASSDSVSGTRVLAIRRVAFWPKYFDCPQPQVFNVLGWAVHDCMIERRARACTMHLQHHHTVCARVLPGRAQTCISCPRGVLHRGQLCESRERVYAVLWLRLHRRTSALGCCSQCHVLHVCMMMKRPTPNTPTHTSRPTDVPQAQHECTG
jgi:hypothetical protein